MLSGFAAVEFSWQRQWYSTLVDLRLLYSDEDKCDESGTYYFEHHRKTDFNLELFLTNNYICHFMVMEAALIMAAPMVQYSGDMANLALGAGGKQHILLLIRPPRGNAAHCD